MNKSIVKKHAANAELKATYPTRLALALKFSVFYYKVIKMSP